MESSRLWEPAAESHRWGTEQAHRGAEGEAVREISVLGPLGRVLTCEVGSLNEVAMRGVEWLERQAGRDQILDELARCSSRKTCRGKTIRDHNLVASLDILSHFGHASASPLIRGFLARPLTASHLYALPLTRRIGCVKPDDQDAVAESLARLLLESERCDLPDDWKSAFAIDVYRALVSFSPATAIEMAASRLESLQGPDLTATLEACAVALRRCGQTLDPEVSGPFSAVIQTVWRAFVDDRRPTSIGNRPGIMGRLLEILGRLGADAESAIGSLTDHPLKHRAVYQFASRPLDFLTPTKRLKLYGQVIDGLIESNSFLSASKFVSQVVMEDRDQGVLRAIFEEIRQSNLTRTR